MATVPVTGAGSAGISRTSSAWRHLDPSLVIAVVGLASLGLLMVYSATHRKLEEAGIDPQYDLKRQAVFMLLGVGVMVLVASIDYRAYRDFAPVIYVVGLLSTVLVLTPLASSIRGTQRWFQLGSFTFQPSELAKLAVIVAVAAYVGSHRAQMDAPRVAGTVALAGVPMGLVYLQPDIGTAMVFGVIAMAVLLVGGARPRHLILLVLAAVVAVVAVLQLGVLKEYQLDRLGAFLDPSNDPQRSAYNLNQSKIAVANGGFMGRGLFQGTQTNLSFVPEQRTDFIFTVVGEELGFLGSVVLLGLFALVMWRTWRIATLAKDLVGTLLCVGVLAMLMFQVFENVGMTMGIMPITGIPLPFVSYGGSSTLAYFAAIGLVLNVHMRRFS